MRNGTPVQFQMSIRAILMAIKARSVFMSKSFWCAYIKNPIKSQIHVQHSASLSWMHKQPTSRASCGPSILEVSDWQVRGSETLTVRLRSPPLIRGVFVPAGFQLLKATGSLTRVSSEAYLASSKPFPVWWEAGQLRRERCVGWLVNEWNAMGLSPRVRALPEADGTVRESTQWILHCL